jgi:hypothetical protein
MVVDAFIRVHKTIEIPKPQPQLQAVTRHIRSATATPPDRSVSLGRPGAVQSNSDLSAFVSLARLASGSPTVRDVGALAWTQLRQLAPRATMVLWTVEGGKDSLVARYVAGPAADRIPATTIRIGERIAGWIAAHGQTMINVDASLDLGNGADDDLRVALATPLNADRGIAGVLALYGPDAFGQQLALTVEMIGPHLARSVTAALAAEATQAPFAVESEPRKTRLAGLSLVSRR